MKDKSKSKKQLLNEIMELRQRAVELEQLKTEYKKKKTALKQQTDDMSLLYEAGKLFSSSLKQEKVFKEISRRCVDVMNVDLFLLRLIENDRLVIKSSYYRSAKEKEVVEKMLAEHPIVIGKGIAGKVAQNGKPAMSGKAPVESVTLPGYINYLKNKQWLVVPMKVQQRIIGVLTFITSDIERSFSQRDLTLAQGVANQAAIAIDNARLFKEVEQSAQKYRTILETSADSILTLNSDLKITVWSSGAERTFGYTRKEIVGQPLQSLVPGPNWRLTEDKLKEAREKGFIRGWQTQKTAKDGKSVDVEMTVTDLGAELGFTVAMRDITERKKAEAAILESKERYQTLFESANDAIVLIDRSVIVECNVEGMGIFGCTSKQIIGKSPYNFSPEKQPDGKNSKEKIQKIINKALKGQPQFFEWLHCRLDGTPFDAEVNMNKIELEGKPYLLLVIRDITIRKQFEKEINMLAHAVKSIRECVSVTDMEDNVIFVNDAFCNTYGYSKDELTGKPISIIRSPNNPPDTIKDIFPATLQGGWQCEVLNKRKDGSEFPVLLSTSVIRDEKQNPIALIGVASDITERRHLETQLRQSQKMEAIGSLAGGIAHDFNNLLMIIRGYSKLVLDRLNENNPHYKSILQIDRASEHAESLIRQLLAFSRKQVLQLKIIDLNALIRELEKMLGRLIGENIELKTLLDSELGYIKVEPNQIEQVIMNIVVNARDAMPGGGKLTVETKNIVLGENNKTMENTAVEPGSYVLLSISDTGMGMDKKTRNHIFEPFFTTKEKGKSTGLGLATVYGIIKQSGGYIWVDSKPGVGTTFKIYLPCTDEGITLDEKSDEPILDGNLKGKETVLIVEDEKDVRNLVCEMLKLQGYNILEAGYGDRALNICKEYNKPIHLVLTDIVMPHISGSRLVELIKPIHPEMKALYMSGYINNAVVNKGILKPDDQFIQKPFTPVDLARKIRGILDKK